MLRFRPVRVLGWCGVVLIAGHIAGLVAHEVWGVDRELGMIRQLDLNAEANFAAWFCSFLLLSSAVLCLVVALVRRLRHQQLAGRWVALGGFLALMSADETSQLHDMATGPLRNGLGLDFGVLYFAWLMPALLILAFAGWYFAPLVTALSPAIRPPLLIAAIVFFAGAVGFEMIGGSVVADGRETLSYHIVITIEECLELIGAFLMLTALLNQVRELQPRITVRWTGAAPEFSLAEEPAESPTDA